MYFGLRPAAQSRLKFDHNLTALARPGGDPNIMAVLKLFYNRDSD